MDAVLHDIGQYWWVLFVFGGSISAAVKGAVTWNERRANRRLERYRIKQNAKVELAKAEGLGRVDKEAARKELAKTVAAHDEVDRRWLGYETDLATILDFPMMVDLREPLTVEFHKARRHAELLRPEPVQALIDDPDALRDYREAVHAYVTAFDVAEQEARRRRRGDFDPLEQERLAKAQRLLALAMSSSATGPERQQAYQRARQELEGLLDPPRSAVAVIERQVRLALEGAERPPAG